MDADLILLGPATDGTSDVLSLRVGRVLQHVHDLWQVIPGEASNWLMESLISADRSPKSHRV